MKRILHMAIIMIPVALLLTGIGLWRHHYLKIMNAKPVKVYNIPGQPSNSTTDTNTSENSEDITDAMTQRFTPKEKVNIGKSSVGTIFGDISEQDLSPEVLAALRIYKGIQPAQASLNAELIPILKAWPVDSDAAESVQERKNALKQKRMNALEILAKYSDEAHNELQATIARENELQRQLTELDRESKEEEAARQKEWAEWQKRWEESKARWEESKARWAESKARWAESDARRANSSKLIDRYGEISDTILTMSPKEQKQALEELNQIQKELNELNR